MTSDETLDVASVASAHPDRPAVVMAGGGTRTYLELDTCSNRFAHWLRTIGVGPGDCIAILMDNDLRFHEVAWAAQRSGLYYTAVNTHLTAAEAAYIIDNSGAKVIVASAGTAALAAALDGVGLPNVVRRVTTGPARPGWESYEAVTDGQPSTPVPGAEEGDMMLYSSGTTGRPKGVRRPLTRDGDVMKRTARFLRDLMGFEDGDVYLSPAPLYHAAPLSWTMGVHRLGGTVVVMERFDASAALRLIEEHRVTHSQWVPTMFVRMLKLGQEARRAHDLSSHRAAVHAAAPCPVPVKHQMIEWWGPILYEYYSGTEGAGVTFIDTPDWLAHPGSVGRPLVGSIRVLDDAGHELPVGEIGNVYFGGSISFEYHGDEAKTREAWHGELATIGDVGFVDAEGYLYLTDRRSHMIISGGVNVYPQESENVLVLHPKVADVAVIGVPDEDLGETVKAVVELVDPGDAGPDTEAELIDYCRSQLAGYKCPRSVDFTEVLPRLPTGKLYKRLLRDQYASSSSGG